VLQYSSLDVFVFFDEQEVLVNTFRSIAHLVTSILAMTKFKERKWLVYEHLSKH
jgi:hypothetical protein